MRCSTLRAAGLVLFGALGLLSWPRRALGYAWMISRGYPGCASCHFDPSGAGLLNDFGRSEAAESLRSRDPGERPDVSANGGLFGNPDWLLTGGAFRTMAISTKMDGGPWSNSFVLMQADLRAAVKLGRWRMDASAGFLQNENSPATVFGNIVAREYWVGPTFADGAVLLRVGRINIPFGLRSPEHTLFVRSATRTDINDTQQHGIALALRMADLRGELLAIAGNFQAGPDAFRERGYSAYLEWAPLPAYAFGVSSLVTRAVEDIYLRMKNIRQAHGVTLRAAPLQHLVILGEVDYVAQSPDRAPHARGLATLLQADIEPWQGLHFIATGETYGSGQPGSTTSWGAWGSLCWFFWPRFDIRADYMHRSLSYGQVRLPIDALMLQLHMFL